MSYQVYILKSLKDGIGYIGCGSSAQEHLRRHSKGDYSFTSYHRQWEIIFQDRSVAFAREKFLKSGQGRKWLDENKIK